MHKDDLEDILDLLIEKGVSHFSCPEFTATFGNAPQASDEPSMADAIEEARRDVQRPSAAKGIFGNPSLWGKNGPPTFPHQQHAASAPTHEDDEA